MKRLIQVLALYMLLVMLVACQSAPVPAVSLTAAIPALPDGSIVIRNGTVIDGTGAEPILNGLVAIKDSEIVAVGAETQSRIPQDAQCSRKNQCLMAPSRYA
jgi:hypothetical protein